MFDELFSAEHRELLEGAAIYEKCLILQPFHPFKAGDFCPLIIADFCTHELLFYAPGKLLYCRKFKAVLGRPPKAGAYIEDYNGPSDTEKGVGDNEINK